MATKICAKLSQYLWRQGDPDVTILESAYISVDSLFLLRIFGLVVSCISWVLMMVVNTEDHFIFLTFWGVYQSVVLFPLLLINQNKRERHLRECAQELVKKIDPENSPGGSSESTPYSHMTLWKSTILAYECTIPISMLIGFVYWVFLFNYKISVIRLTLSMFSHGGIQVCWMLEFYYGHIPMYRHHYWVFLIFGGLYLVWNCVWSLTMYPVYQQLTTWKDLLTLLFVIVSFLLATATYFLLEWLSRRKSARLAATDTDRTTEESQYEASEESFQIMRGKTCKF